ncbi:MAG: putative lipid II flippase FtsW [Patescibacteria group bacterium]|nr:putative lipid II flippase FtsW [Patescibacteria group bacterium]
MTMKFLKNIDYSFLALVGLIVIFGLIVLSSASGPLGYQKFGDSYYYLKHQIVYGFLPGIAMLLICARIPFTFWKKKALILFIISFILLLAVFIPGIGAEYGTAHSWLSIGGFSFQPSELLKLTFLIYLAAWLEARGENKLKDINSGLVPFLISLGVVMLAMVLQPDLGTMTIIVVSSLIVYFAAGAPWAHIGLLGGAGAALLFILIKMAPYRSARFMTFLHPELDPQGIGYHINQALLAIGSGGILGLGLGHSRQKFQYLPEVAGDSIFAVMAEELGLIFSLLVVVAFVALLIKGFRIAASSDDVFGRFLATGISAWFAVQALINIGSMIGLMPMTGVPLPFISYGGSALMVSLAAVGILLNIDRHARA